MVYKILQRNIQCSTHIKSANCPPFLSNNSNRQYMLQEWFSTRGYFLRGRYHWGTGGSIPQHSCGPFQLLEAPIYCLVCARFACLSDSTFNKWLRLWGAFGIMGNISHTRSRPRMPYTTSVGMGARVCVGVCVCGIFQDGDDIRLIYYRRGSAKENHWVSTE